MIRVHNWKQILILGFSLLLLFCGRAQAQAPTITNISPTAGPVGSPVTITGTGFGASQGSSTVTLNGTNAVATSWSDTSIVAVVPAGASSGTFTVTVSGQPASSSTFTVTSLPSGWTDQDIGSVGLAGSASYATGALTISGAGHGMISYPTDGFHFDYQPLSGDGTIVARVVSKSNNFAQAGIMIRETLDAGAKSMFVGSYASTVYTFVRTAIGGTPVSTAGGSAPLPYWVKLVRTGSGFTGYQSLDGVNWAQVGTSQTISMVQNVYVGLALSSGSTGTLYTGTLDSVSITSAANPAPVITSFSATTGSIGSQAVLSGSNFGASPGSGVVLLNDALVTINSWTATSITITIPTGATSGPLVISVLSSMNDSNPVDFTVTSTPLPAGWLDRDVGQVGKAGSASYSSGIFTDQAAGTGNNATECAILQNNPDSFHFVYQPLTGDGTIVARLVSPTYVSGQAGIIFRETMDPNAKSVLVGDYSGSVYAWYRLLGGGVPGCYQPQVAGPLPYWFKLTRTGNSFNAYQSPDGFDWTPVGGTFVINMTQTVYVGLAMSSLSSSTLQNAYFDSVSVSSTATSAPVITSLSATTGSVGSQVVISGSGFGASQGSSVVVLNDAPVTINSWSATSITITIPTGATSGLMNVLVGPSMDSSNGIAFTVTSSPLPSGWLDTDVGAVGKTGSASYANGVFTVQGAAQYLAAYADAFHFVYQPMNTSGTIVVRVTGGTVGARVGVMMRETLDANAANAATNSSLNTSTSASMNYRSFLGGYELSAGSQPVTEPFWLKVVRNVNQFSAYAGADGVGWTQLGTTQTITTAQTVYVGFGVASLSTATLDTATFDNVSVSLGAALPNPIVTSISPTSGAPGTTVTLFGSGFGATQGSSAVSFNGATAAITSWSDSQIIAVVPDGAATGPVMVTVGGITYVGPMFTVNFIVQLTDSLGNQTSFVSSLEGGQYSYTSAQGSGCSSCTTRGTMQNEYDGNGNVQAVTDANGNITTYQYDSSNNLTSQSSQVNANTVATTQYAYNSFGEVMSMTDPLGKQTSNTYDSHGNLVTVTTPSPGPGVAGSVTTFTYDIKGELLTIKDPLNNVTTLTYYPTGLINTITDAQNNVTTYAYDAHGNRTSVTDALNHTTTFAYDAMDRLTQITYPDTTTTQFGYDYRGRRTTVTDQNGKVTTYAFDDADRLTSVTDANNHVTTYAYDTENNLTSIQDANLNTTSFMYDAFGRVTKTTFPSTLFETYGYDADNNLIAKTDRKNQQITYAYDQINRLTQKTYPDGTTVNYTYDLDSRLTQVTDPTGTYSFTFDNMGRLTGTTTSYSFVTRNFTTSYTYDKASNRTGFTDPESGSTTYAYDTLNRLTTLTPPAAYGAGNFGFSYDVLSRRTQMTRPNSLSTIYAYDNLSRLASVLHQLSGSTIDGATYTVDNAGNRTAKTDQRTALTTNYGYDNIYELLSATQGATTTESYTYDPVGNRLTSLGVANYTNNTSNELTSTSNATYAYDNNGNTLTKVVGSSTTSYSWDFENRLTSVTLPGSGGTVSFAYDPFGRRIKKVSSAGTSIYAYDYDNLIEETNGAGTVVARYAQPQTVDEPLAMLRSGATSYYDGDGLGSITSLSSSAGSLAQTYGYDSFGKQTSSSGSLTNPFQFTAREFDSETSLYYYRARYYDPSTGRFLSEDPFWIDIPDARISAYAYVANEPTTVTDPLGLYGLSKKGNPPPVPPSPRLDRALRCLEGCYGKPLLITSTSEPIPQHRPGTPHRRGEAADISYPATPADRANLLCCAAGCNFQFALDEGAHPSGPNVAPHIHVQFTPARPGDVKPSWPNGVHGDLPKAGPTCACGTGALP